ncbi:MAG TPA: acetate--CoA ligase family protein [Pseudonocardia sp.]|nr:acetate--CoA ligase family protein [Pseudonocardia sp.]
MADPVDLSRLLRPASIAVIGDSRSTGRVLEQNRRLGYRGPIWPVHPARPVVAGEPAFSEVAALPGVPDAAFVAVPAADCAPVVAELAAAGCGAAVVYSSGFAETGTGGAERQRELAAAAGSMPLLGPNCYGMVNYFAPALIWPDEHGGVPLPAGERGVAVVSQSSSIAISVTMADTGLPVGCVLTVGNGAGVGVAQAAEAVLDRERVSAIGMVVESLADVRAMERLAARARERRIGLVALVLGRTEPARRALLTHTASLAGNAAAAANFLHRNGIGEVTSVDALLAALGLLHCGGPLPGTRLSSLSSSGGEAALIADATLGRRTRFPELTGQQRTALHAVLGDRVALANPLDYHTYVWGRPDEMRAAFAAMVRGPAELHLLFADLPRADRCADGEWMTAIEAFARACTDVGARGALVAALAGNLNGPRAADWVRRGLPVLGSPGVAMEAIEAAAAIGAAWTRPAAAPLARPGGGHRGDPVGRPGPTRPRPGARLLDECASKHLLRRRGVPVPAGRACRSGADAAAAAAELAGPVAVKALGPAHKTEEHAVRLGLVGSAAVDAAAAELLARFPAVLVERMVPGVVVELLVGIRVDPVFGPVLTVGAGGILAELLRDVASLVLPADPAQIRDALLGLRCAALLAGHRGGTAADPDAVAAVVHRLTAVALDLPGMLELEVNPLVVTPGGAWACDALAVLTDPEEEETP